jgi:hypothetical protein
VKVGKLLKWRTGMTPITDNLLYVQVGTLVATKPYWLHFYTEKELDAIGKEGKTDIFRTSESESAYSLAKWVIQDQQVVGIHLEARVCTSGLDCSCSFFLLSFLFSFCFLLSFHLL